MGILFAGIGTLFVFYFLFIQTVTLFTSEGFGAAVGHITKFCLGGIFLTFFFWLLWAMCAHDVRPVYFFLIPIVYATDKGLGITRNAVTIIMASLGACFTPLLTILLVPEKK